MLTLLLVCSFSPRVHSIPRGPQNIAKTIVYAQRFVASNNATHSCDKSHNRWLCPLRSISANASACFSLRLRSARRGSRRGGIAQLVERLNGIQEVAGSTPTISTIKSRGRTRGSFYWQKTNFDIKSEFVFFRIFGMFRNFCRLNFAGGNKTAVNAEI